MSDIEFNIPFTPFIPTSHNFKNLTGLRVSRLTVVSIYGRKRERTYWLCQCVCGTWKVIVAQDLLGAKVQSCGCLRNERIALACVTHNKTRTPEYRSFIRAKDRCVNPRNAKFSHYGQRGIQMRFNSFEEFYAEIGDRPSPTHSLDRIDNDGHYEKGNIRWATKQQQARNRRGMRMITYQGQTKCLTEWAELLNINLHTLFGRLYTSKWPVERAFTTPT